MIRRELKYLSIHFYRHFEKDGHFFSAIIFHCVSFLYGLVCSKEARWNDVRDWSNGNEEYATEEACSIFIFLTLTHAHTQSSNIS